MDSNDINKVDWELIGLSFRILTLVSIDGNFYLEFVEQVGTFDGVFLVVWQDLSFNFI